MTDREMLELAARAAGIVSVKPEFDDKKRGICIKLRTMQWLTVYEEPVKYWNPRDDDGDALRLAVQCGILNLDDALFYGDRDIDYQTDPYAATRRAIVRAAAEIGRQMEETK